jgi:predicted nucleotidyltransferase
MVERDQLLKRKLPKSVRSAIDELKQALLEIYGERLSGIYLYGSYARGDFHPGSDIDIVVALKGTVTPGREIDRMSERVSDICLEHDVLIAIFPVPEDWLQIRQSPLFVNLRREGVAL